MTLPFDQLSFAEIYEQEIVGPLFRPFAERILDEVGVTAGDLVLDIACGTGIVARLARERLGNTATVVGVDVNPAMLDVARRVAPQIDWRAGDAGVLPLRDNEQFSVVVCQQGMQFFPEQAKAASEMHRALATDGRLAVSTWRPDDELPVLLALRRVAEQHIGPISDRRHSFGESGPLEELLRRAGLHDVRSRIVTLNVHFPDASVFVRLNAMALIGMSAAAKTLNEDQRKATVAAIVRDSSEVVAPHVDATGFSFEIASNVATARA